MSTKIIETCDRCGSLHERDPQEASVVRKVYVIVGSCSYDPPPFAREWCMVCLEGRGLVKVLHAGSPVECGVVRQPASGEQLDGVLGELLGEES